MIFSKKRRSAPSEDGRSAGTGRGSAAVADADRGHEGRRPAGLDPAAVLEPLDGLGGTAEELAATEEAAGTEVQLGKEPAKDAHAAIGAEPREGDVLAADVEEVDVPHDRSEAERLGQSEAEVEGGRVPEDVAVDGGSVVTEHRRHPEAETDASTAVERQTDLVAGPPRVGGVAVAAQDDQRTNGHPVLDGDLGRRRGGRREVQALEEPRAGAVLRRGHGSGGKPAPLLREADRGSTDSLGVAGPLFHRRHTTSEGVEPPVHLGEALAHVRVGSGLGADLHPLGGVGGRAPEHRNAEVPADAVTVGVDRLTTGLHRDRAHGALAAGLGQVGTLVVAAGVAEQLLSGAGLAPEVGVPSVVAADAHRQAEGLVSPRGAHRRGATGRELVPARGQLLASGGELAAEGGERVAVATARRGVGAAHGLGLVEGRHRLGGEAAAGRASVGGAGRTRLLRDAVGEGDPLRAGRRPVGRAGHTAAGRDGAAQRAEVGLLRARRGGNEERDEHHAREGEDLLHDRNLRLMAGKRP